MSCSKCGNNTEILFDMGEGEICQHCFLDGYKPTQYSDGPWLHVKNEQTREMVSKSRLIFRNRKYKQVLIEGRKLKLLNLDDSENEIDLTIENIDKIASEQNVLVGKWLIYNVEPDIDNTWFLIASATIKGILGMSSKVSTALSRKEQFVICVYTENYLDIDDVMRVRNNLFDLGFHNVLYYKPDLYTLLGIYAKTTHLAAYRYKK